MAEPIASTGRMLVVARPALSADRIEIDPSTWTSTHVGTIGALANMVPIGARFDRSAPDAQMVKKRPRSFECARPDVMEVGDSPRYIDAMVFEADLDARREGITGPCDRCRIPTALVVLVVFMDNPNYLTFLCGECYAGLAQRKEGDVV